MDNKTCIQCGEAKSLSFFYKRKNYNSTGKTYYQSTCKECADAYRKNWQSSTIGKECMRRGRLRHRYGITIEQYDFMLQAQGGVCKICLQEDPKGRLAVDHCHKTGRVRGLLCRICNNQLGVIEKYKRDQTPWDNYLSAY